MSVSYSLTFICDSCDEEYWVGGEIPSMPPYWISAQLMLSNRDGYIPPHEEDDGVLHFCCKECFKKYISSQEFNERTLLVDQMPDDEIEGEDDEKEDTT